MRFKVIQGHRMPLSIRE